MALSWLHVSDFHFKGGDPYDRDVVLRALVRSVRTYRAQGRKPDLIFATGDVAHGGKSGEYAAATPFFDALLEAAGVAKRGLFVIPGNHDVDRDLGIGLVRTLGSREEADACFGPAVPKMHIVHKQREFVRWHDAYFAGIRAYPQDSTCGPVELVEIGPHRLGILPVNSALFCQDDGDHGKLWVGRRWPNRALYVTVEGDEAHVFPIRYEDEPHEVWTVDPSVFPAARGYTGVFPLRRPKAPAPARPPAPAAGSPAPTRFPCNIASRRNLPFVGREALLEQIGAAFRDRGREAVVVLHGPPGVGKSEFAREFARRAAQAYPGGRFVVAAGEQALAVDFARLGATLLDLDQPTGLPLAEQALRVLASLGHEPTLLIYDNVQALDAVQPWLPPAGMRCHALLTTNLDRWDAGWNALEVPPLSPAESVELVGRIAGADVRARFGEHLAAVAEGLPVQLVPASATLAYEARRESQLPRRLPAARRAGPAPAACRRAPEPAAYPGRRAATASDRRRRLERRRVPAPPRRLPRPASAAGRQRAAPAPALCRLPAAPPSRRRAAGGHAPDRPRASAADAGSGPRARRQPQPAGAGGGPARLPNRTGPLGSRCGVDSRR